MRKSETTPARFSAKTRRAGFGVEELGPSEAEMIEKGNADVDVAMKLVAEKLMESVKNKWGTAAALEAATGICPTEISRIRHGKFDRFSLERLVRLLWIVDPDVRVEFQLKLTPVARRRRTSDKEIHG
ncbi:MAG: XRE family transcriptional regulator [Hyphomicrobium sp.]|nr:XRE family transcriptional regulator [Hyphomicrobium sp.]